MADTPWVDGPLTLIETPSKTRDLNSHGSIYIASEMAHAHNAMIRGLNAIYLQAAGMKQAKDIADFLFFTRAWAAWVLHHHTLEENIMFPEWEQLIGKPGFFEGDTAQHHTFSDGLNRLQTYATDTNPQDYAPDKLKAIIDEFKNVFHTHLCDEIEDLLRLREFDGEKLLLVYKKANATASEQEKTVVPPMVLGLVDKTYEGGMHNPFGLHWTVPYLVKYLLSRKHQGSWRFLPCDMFGQPKPLAFVA